MKTFRHATYDTPYGGAFTIEPHFKSGFCGLLFHHLVVEYIINGRCTRRMEVHPWEAKFSIIGTMRLARKLVYGKKSNHVKS